MSGAFDTVDAQVHLTLELDERALLASMDALGIRGAVIDEFWGAPGDERFLPCAPLPDGGCRPLSPYAQAAALRHPDRLCYLQRVDLRDPERAAVARLLGQSPGCRALRLMLFSDDDRRGLAAGGYDDVLRQAQSDGLPLCLFGADGPVLRAITGRLPSLALVLDHCGCAWDPRVWEDVLAAASVPTVHLKWSHAHRAFGRGDDPAATIQRQFLRAIEAFGAQRILWASDITQERSGASWSDLLGFIRDNTALSRAQKEWVLAGTARSVFRWESKGGDHVA
jgi:L-fuconolactonase